ncbi:Ankyrin repeat domain-containing protein 17 [Chionoecetes opilio]|uniref:Ankyrin repeat domain-containing protein 17 n=1 Tax=Chionoecetes opilio TaxID=41210 RepID=A0A8J4XPF7_CHIOP|nr:Ankyrin repeat domain-containing protein 17 [Chionoecetes opilio]
MQQVNGPADCYLQPHGGASHVLEAAQKGHPASVNQYLKQNGDVNATYKGDTLLHAACSHGRENVLCILLLNKKLCVNLRNRYNETGLMTAAANGYKNCVETLFEYNHKAYVGPTYVSSAARGKCTMEDRWEFAHRRISGPL